MGLRFHRDRASAMALAPALVTLFITTLSVPTVKPDKYRTPNWAAEMRAFIEAQPRFNHLGIRVVDRERSEAFGFRDDVPMYLASGVKLAFMIATFRALEAGTLRMNQTVTYTEDDKRDGATEINPQKVGSRFSIRQLLHWMMKSSDNAASDFLIDELSLDGITSALEQERIYGFSPLTRLLEVRRGFYRVVDVRADDISAPTMRDIRWTRIWDPQIRRLTKELGRQPKSITKADLLDGYRQFYDTGVNEASMQTITYLFERMLDGTLVSLNSSREMLELMSGARTSQNRILGKLPKGTDVAHKTGSQYLHFCDLGIVFLPVPKGVTAPAEPVADGRGPPLIITMCTEDIPVEPAEVLMSAVASHAYKLAMGVRGQ